MDVDEFQVCPEAQKQPAGAAGTAVTIVEAPPVQVTVEGGIQFGSLQVLPVGQ